MYKKQGTLKGDLNEKAIYRDAGRHMRIIQGCWGIQGLATAGSHRLP